MTSFERLNCTCYATELDGSVQRLPSVFNRHQQALLWQRQDQRSSRRGVTDATTSSWRAPDAAAGPHRYWEWLFGPWSGSPARQRCGKRPAAVRESGTHKERGAFVRTSSPGRLHDACAGRGHARLWCFER